ncbi:MAG: hypothetical protein ABIG64_03215 [Candidatus Omnitrophota bacterium]
MKQFVSIEIGEEYLKIIASARKGIQTKLINCFANPITTFTDKQIIGTIIDIFRKNKFKPTFVAISLPRNLVTLRNLNFPSQDTKEINKMIDLHISRIIPYKKEDVIFGYRIAGIDEMGYSKIVLAIAQNETIKRPMKILDQAGFLIDSISLSSYGVWLGLIRNMGGIINSADLYLALDIDSVYTDFIVFKSDNLLFSRSIAIKLHELQDDLGKRRLIGEVRQSLLIFANDELRRKPKIIFLSGVNVQGLDKAIERELNLEVKIMPKLIKDKELGKENKENHLFNKVSFSGVAELVLGESDKRLTFDLPEIKIRKSFRDKIANIVMLSIFSIYLFTVGFLILWGRMYNKQVYLNNISQKANSIERELGDIVYQIERIEFVKNQLNLRNIPLFLLGNIQSVITDGVTIEVIRFEEDNKVILRGQVLQLSDVMDLTNSLKEITRIKDVQTKDTRRKKTKNKEVTNFEINFYLDM